MGLLETQVALITGSASGQGAATARLFAAEGATIVVADVQENLGREVAQSIGSTAVYVQLDVTSEDGWANAVSVANTTFGSPSILVNCAGVVHRKLIEESSRQEFEQVLAVNLIGAYLGMRAVLAGMRQRASGAIVNIGSSASMRGAGGRALYGASKWGLRGLTKAAALEFGEYGIRVNCIQPGAIDTPMLRSSDQALPTPDLPVPRFGAPEEIAQAALFLASAHASYVTGADLAVDGGDTAGVWVIDRGAARRGTDKRS